MIFLFLILGLIVGSFVNVLIIRTHEERSWVKGRSACPHCDHQLAWHDLIPVVSWLYLRGRCRYCGKPISWQYPAVELSTGLLFGLLWWHFAPVSAAGWVQLIIWLLITVLLLAAAVYDARWQQLPDHFTVPAIGLAVVLLLVEYFWLHQPVLQMRLLDTVIFGGAIYLLWLFSGGKWIGDGDIRLCVLLGLLLDGKYLLAAIVIGFTSAALTALGLMATGKKHLQDRMPLGCFLLLGLYVALLFGQPLVSAYGRLFGLTI